MLRLSSLARSTPEQLIRMEKRFSTVERLEEGEKKYYRRVEELLKGEETDNIFSNNIVRQIQSDGVARVFCDKDGSRTVELLLQTRECDASLIKTFLEPIIPSFNSVATDRCGSHSLEALVKAVGAMVDCDDSESLQSLFLRGCSCIRGSLSDLLVHPYAGHVVASVVQVLSGVYVADHLTRSRYSQEFRKAKMDRDERQRKTVVDRKVAVPQSFTEMLDKLGKWTCKLESFSELLVHMCAGPVLQVLLRVLVERLPKRGGRMIRQILKSITPVSVSKEPEDATSSEPHSPPPLPLLFTCPVGSHLVEVLVEVASADLHQWIYESCFKDQVLSFALHPVANYPLQQFMATAEPELLSVIVTNLLPHIEDVLYVGHSGVVVKLVQSGLRCPALQPDILQALLAAFHAEGDPRSCVPLFLTLTAYEVYFSKDETTPRPVKRPWHVQGSLMLQALLKYSSPRIVASSLVRTETDDVIKMSCDPVSSHVIDAFMGSPTVSLKKKTKLIDRIKLHLVSLCKDKHGSRVVDAVWRNCEVSKKESLAQELLSHKHELSEDFYGRLVLRNCNIVHCRRKQGGWQEKERASERTRELFRDILEEPVEEGKRKRKRKRSQDEEEEAVVKAAGKEPVHNRILQDTNKRKNKTLSLFDD